MEEEDGRSDWWFHENLKLNVADDFAVGSHAVGAPAIVSAAV